MMSQVPVPQFGPPALAPIAALRRFMRPRAPIERCELCAQPLGQRHPHLFELATRQLVCSCDACAILFSSGQQTKYRRVPQRIETLSDLQISDMQWQSIGVPINLAFFFRSSNGGQIRAVYPSPAGATETLLVEEAWRMLAADNPVLLELRPDVEAFLVNRMGAARDYFRVPIDECYKLVGLIKMRWRGLSGGRELWEELARFMDALKERSVRPTRHA